MSGVGRSPGLGEGYEPAEEGDGVHGYSGIRWGEEWAWHPDRHEYVSAPARRRWSWQNRGGPVAEETAEPAALTEVTRAEVVEALDAWIDGTGASALGQKWSVTHPAGRRSLVGWLTDGPVASVLEALGYAVVE